MFLNEKSQDYRKKETSHPVRQTWEDGGKTDRDHHQDEGDDEVKMRTKRLGDWQTRGKRRKRCQEGWKEVWGKRKRRKRGGGDDLISTVSSGLTTSPTWSDKTVDMRRAEGEWAGAGLLVALLVRSHSHTTGGRKAKMANCKKTCEFMWSRIPIKCTNLKLDILK